MPHLPRSLKAIFQTQLCSQCYFQRIHTPRVIDTHQLRENVVWTINILRPGQSGYNFVDDIFQFIFSVKIVWCIKQGNTFITTRNVYWYLILILVLSYQNVLKRIDAFILMQILSRICSIYISQYYLYACTDRHSLPIGPHDTIFCQIPLDRQFHWSLKFEESNWQ